MKPLGLVLCGGKSRRMGLDKWSLKYQGRSWAEKQAEILTPYCEKVYLSVASPLPLDLPQIIDVYPDSGPLGGWLSFKNKFPDRDLLTVPVDMPQLEAKTLSTLLGKSSAYLRSENSDAYLAAFILSKDLQTLNELFTSGLREAGAFWQALPHRKIPADSRQLQNINSPQEAGFELKSL